MIAIIFATFAFVPISAHSGFRLRDSNYKIRTQLFVVMETNHTEIDRGYIVLCFVSKSKSDLTSIELLIQFNDNNCIVPSQI